MDETLFDQAAAASGKSHIGWDKILRGKMLAREEIVRMFNQLLSDLSKKRDEVTAIRAIVIRAEEEEAQVCHLFACGALFSRISRSFSLTVWLDFARFLQLRMKFETVQRKVDDTEKRYVRSQ